MSILLKIVKKVVGGVAKVLGFGPEKPKVATATAIKQEITAVDTKIDKDKADATARAANLGNLTNLRKKRVGAASNVLAGELDEEAETAKRRLLGSKV